MDQERDKNMVQLLLDLKANLDLIVKESFQNNETFGHALKVHLIEYKPLCCVMRLHVTAVN